MTREEATIQALRNHIEALEETIKTLEQEPCEDAVSRKEVIDILDNYDGLDNTIEEFIDSLKNIYEALPFVTPTRPKGKWIHNKAKDGQRYITCSLCGRNNQNLTETDFCSKCGADMREVEE